MKANTDLKIFFVVALISNLSVQRVLSSKEAQEQNKESKIMTAFANFIHHSENCQVLGQIDFNFQDAMDDPQFKVFIKETDPDNLASETE